MSAGWTLSSVDCAPHAGPAAWAAAEFRIDSLTDYGTHPTHSGTAMT